MPTIIKGNVIVLVDQGLWDLSRKYACSRTNTPIPKRLQVLINSDFCCQGCGVKASHFVGHNDNVSKSVIVAKKGKSDILLTIDHVIPRSLGGRSALENYTLLCEVCNHRKSHNIVCSCINTKKLCFTNKKLYKHETPTPIYDRRTKEQRIIDQKAFEERKQMLRTQREHEQVKNG